ncbi:hypothetical protein ABZ504_55965, partial [Streptomyces mirabilis]
LVTRAFWTGGGEVAGQGPLCVSSRADFCGTRGEELAQLRGAQSGTTAEVARELLERLSQSAELIDRAVLHTAAAAVVAGVALEEVAQWSRLPAEELSQILAAGRSED